MGNEGEDTKVKTGIITDCQSRYIDFDIVSFHVEGAPSISAPELGIESVECGLRGSGDEQG